MINFIIFASMIHESLNFVLLQNFKLTSLLGCDELKMCHHHLAYTAAVVWTDVGADEVYDVMECCWS